MKHSQIAGSDHGVRGRPLLGAMLASGFVLVAVALEVISGSYANSPVRDWAYRVSPLAWPQPVRVAW